MATEHDRVSADEARDLLANLTTHEPWEEGAVNIYATASCPRHRPGAVMSLDNKCECLVVTGNVLRGDRAIMAAAPRLAHTVIAQAAEIVELRAERDRLQRACDEGLPRELILCPACGQRHIDGANGVEFATRPHHTHLCQHCGHVWDAKRWSFGADVPAPVRYRRVALKGHTSLGVCRIEDVEVGGVPMLRATTLCDATPRVEEFPGTSVHSLGVLTPEEAMDAAAKAATARAEQARRDAEYAAQDAREQEARRVARASATVSVTVVGENVELRPTVDGVRRHDLLRRDDAEVAQALRAAVADLYNGRILYGADDRAVGLEVVREADRVENLVAMLHELGFGTVTRLPDQPARTEDADVPF
jgi:hypothetical protein